MLGKAGIAFSYPHPQIEKICLRNQVLIARMLLCYGSHFAEKSAHRKIVLLACKLNLKYKFRYYKMGVNEDQKGRTRIQWAGFAQSDNPLC